MIFVVTSKHSVALQQGIAAEAFVVLAAAALDFQCHGSAEYPFWRALRRGQGLKTINISFEKIE